MEEETRYFLELFNSSPTLVLFGDILNSDKVNGEIAEIVNIGKKEELNPIEVVMESLVNVISEDISRKELTCAKDRILINKDVQNKAVETVLNIISANKLKLKKLHSQWLDWLRSYLEQLYHEVKSRNVDEVIFLVGRRFRISSQSTIKALNSI